MAKYKCDLTNEELIERCNEWVSKLAKTGGSAWNLHVPVSFNTDPDMLFVELANRFKESLSTPERTAVAADEHPTHTVSAEVCLRGVFNEWTGKTCSDEMWAEYLGKDSIMLTLVAMKKFAASQFRTPAPEGENIFDKNGEQVKDGDNLIYIGTNMSGVGVRNLNGRLIVVGQFNCGYLSEWMAAKDFQSIEIDKTNYDSTTPTTPATADSLAATAEEIKEGLQNSYWKETGEFSNDSYLRYAEWLEDKIADYILSGYRHKPDKGEVVTLEDLAITASEMEWPDEIMVTIKKLVSQ